jgi:hypothetical protein
VVAVLANTGYPLLLDRSEISARVPGGER